jgi:hypothetical protein
MRSAILLLIVTTACATTHPEYSMVPDDEDDPMALSGRERTAGSAHVEKSRSLGVTSAGMVRRADLLAVLDAGIPRFLQTVEVEPLLESGRFQGWRIVRFYTAGVDLLPGDVVLAVNGHRCEKPDDLSDLWEALRFTKEIVVEFLRGDERRELHFTVIQ